MHRYQDQVNRIEETYFNWGVKRQNERNYHQKKDFYKLIEIQ